MDEPKQKMDQKLYKDTQSSSNQYIGLQINNQKLADAIFHCICTLQLLPNVE